MTDVDNKFEYYSALDNKYQIIKMSIPTINAVLLSAKGDVKKAKLKLNDNDELDIECIQTYFRKKTAPVQLGYYEYDTQLLFLIGYKEGKAGTENKHELPPPYDNIIAFGDVLLIASTERDWKYPMNFSPEQYQKFYDSVFGGFESVDEESDEGEENDIDESDIEDDAADDAADDAVGDEESDSEELIESEGEVEEDVEVAPQKQKKATAAKKVVASSGYQKQQQLLLQSNFIELSSESTFDNVKQRQITLKRFSFLKEEGFSDQQISQFESAIYEASCKHADKMKVIKHWDNFLFNDIYKNIQRTLVTNLHTLSPINNHRLLTRLKEGELKLTDLPFMSSYEMYPENWKELADRQMLREQKLLEGNKGAATDRFKCNRCGKRECSYYEMQTRSADEPMTIFINCLNCGKRWRQ